MRIHFTTLFVLFFFFSQPIHAQIIETNQNLQQHLSQLSSEIWKQKTDSARLINNDLFLREFQYILNKYKFPLDSIQGITETHTSDRNIQLFTWNVPLNNGTSYYYGFIRLQNTKIIPIQSRNQPKAISTIDVIELDNWYGALYYKIIENTYQNTNYYTLLGWDAYDNTMNRKLIEILNIKNDTILLGQAIFKNINNIQARVVVEYSDKASCLLRYDQQYVKVQKRKKEKLLKHNMIIMDRLVPISETAKGINKFYVPSGEIYDGYIFEEGYWVLKENIVVKNPTVKPTKRKP